MKIDTKKNWREMSSQNLKLALALAFKICLKLK